MLPVLALLLLLLLLLLGPSAARRQSPGARRTRQPNGPCLGRDGAPLGGGE